MSSEHFEMSEQEGKARKSSTSSSSDERKSNKEKGGKGHSWGWEWTPAQVYDSHHHYPVYPHSRECCDSPDQKHLHTVLPKSDKKVSAFQLWQKRYRRQKALSTKQNY